MSSLGILQFIVSLQLQTQNLKIDKIKPSSYIPVVPHSLWRRAKPYHKAVIASYLTGR